MIKIGLDIGLRSNGLIALDVNNNIIDMVLLTTVSKAPNTETRISIVKSSEDIIIYNSRRIIHFIKQFSRVHTVNIERLSYNSVSSTKDILAGIHWSVRSALKYYLNIKCNVISPAQWRKGIITSWDLVKYEIEYPNEEMNKLIPYLKLPKEDKKRIDKYIKILRNDYVCSMKAHYDLSDAFYIAKT